MKLYIPEIGDVIGLDKDWEFTLHPESRNESLIKALGFKFDYRTTKPIAAILPATTLLAIDRIYIRKGQVGYSSISFIIKNGAFQGKRFWAKLKDVNEIECQPNESLTAIARDKDHAALLQIWEPRIDWWDLRDKQYVKETSIAKDFEYETTAKELITKPENNKKVLYTITYKSSGIMQVTIDKPFLGIGKITHHHSPREKAKVYTVTDWNGLEMGKPVGSFTTIKKRIKEHYTNFIKNGGKI